MKYIYLSGNSYNSWSIEETNKGHRILLKEFVSKNNITVKRKFEYNVSLKNKAIQFIENLKKDYPTDKFLY